VGYWQLTDATRRGRTLTSSTLLTNSAKYTAANISSATSGRRSRGQCRVSGSTNLLASAYLDERTGRDRRAAQCSSMLE